MKSSRTEEAITYTAVTSAVFGVGLFLFSVDMRTMRLPEGHALAVEFAAYALLTVAVVTSVLAITAFARRRDW